MTMPTLQTVDRALQVIELLRVSHATTVSQVAEVLGVGTSIAHRLLVTLESRGYARHVTGSRAYCAGPALEGLTDHNTDADSIAVSQDELRRLQAQTDETVHLSGLAGRHVRFFYSLVSHHIMRVESRVGDLLPAHSSAAGRALLATVPSVILTRLYPDPTLITTGKTTTRTLDQLEDELTRTRERGYARNVEETEPGVASVAMTVTPPPPWRPFAITVSGPQFRLRFEHGSVSTNERRIIRRLESAIEGIQNRLS